MYQSVNGVSRHTVGLRDAIRHGAVVISLGVGFMVVAALWVSTCGGTTGDSIGCGGPQRTLLSLGAPIILLAGGVLAFVRTHQPSVDNESRWAWHGAGALLLVLTVVSLLTSLSPLLPALG